MTRIPVKPDSAARAEERAAVDAIARVLDAERAARERVAQAEREAAAGEEVARAEARAIAERTERRLASVRAAFAARTARAVAAAAEAMAGFDAPHPLTADDATLARMAAAALAAELTAGAKGRPGEPR
jgi:hypothetical protein